MFYIKFKSCRRITFLKYFHFSKNWKNFRRIYKVLNINNVEVKKMPKKKTRKKTSGKTSKKSRKKKRR